MDKLVKLPQIFSNRSGHNFQRFFEFPLKIRVIAPSFLMQLFLSQRLLFKINKKNVDDSTVENQMIWWMANDGGYTAKFSVCKKIMLWAGFFTVRWVGWEKMTWIICFYNECFACYRCIWNVKIVWITPYKTPQRF